MSNNISIKKKSGNKSVIDWITESDTLLIFGSFGCAVLVVIVLTGIFQAGPVVRKNVLYNSIGALCMALAFIYIIFKFMGNQVIILGESVDIGMFIYIAIVLFVMFILGN
jgi:hypothetical protein